MSIQTSNNYDTIVEYNPHINALPDAVQSASLVVEIFAKKLLAQVNNKYHNDTYMALLRNYASLNKLNDSIWHEAFQRQDGFVIDSSDIDKSALNAVKSLAIMFRKTNIDRLMTVGFHYTDSRLPEGTIENAAVSFKDESAIGFRTCSEIPNILLDILHILSSSIKNRFLNLDWIMITPAMMNDSRWIISEIGLIEIVFQLLEYATQKFLPITLHKDLNKKEHIHSFIKENTTVTYPKDFSSGYPRYKRISISMKGSSRDFRLFKNLDCLKNINIDSKAI